MGQIGPSLTFWCITRLLVAVLGGYSVENGRELLRVKLDVDNGTWYPSAFIPHRAWGRAHQ